MGGSKDSFTTYNPITNFIFFIGAIILTMIFRHPVFILCSVISSLIYYFTIKKAGGFGFFSFLLVIFVVITFINPLFNTNGSHKLFTVFGMPYYFEALINGAVTGAMVAAVLVWFACYNAVMTSDKFIYIFGRIIPSVSLVISMILRLIPDLKNKFNQISGARKCIGMASDYQKNSAKMKNGMTEIAVLTSWALEGGIVTADSMRCRGYGTGKRTFFQIYNYDWKNILISVFMVIFMVITLFCSAKGASEVTFAPELSMTRFDNLFLVIGIISYFLFLIIPTFLNLKEAIIWRFLRSRI